MQSIEGYVENGQFFSIKESINDMETFGRRRAILTVLDEPVQEDALEARERRLKALDDFIAQISASDEYVPEFGGVKLREEES